MYHQPIKLPFSKLCKSVKSCLWLTFTLLHQFEPVLLFETLFFFLFSMLYTKYFLSIWSCQCLKQISFKIEKILSCLFWKQTWAIGYISMKHAWINECQCLFQYMLQAGYPPQDDLWSMARMKKQNENENEKWKMQMKSSLSWKPERAA